MREVEINPKAQRNKQAVIRTVWLALSREVCDAVTTQE